MATKSPPEKVLKARRDTVRSRGKAPAASLLPGHSDTSAAGQGLRAEMTAADAISMTGENLGLFSVPENQHFDPGGSRGPNIELGGVRPRTRSQREVGQTPKGGKGGKGDSGAPAQTKSSRKRKQPNQSPTTECAGGLQLPEALESPGTPQPPSSLSSQPSSSHHFELSVGNLESPGPTLRSSTARGNVSTPAPKVPRQAVLTVSGPHSRAPESSCEGRDHSTPVGQELCQQAPLQVPDDGLCHSGPDLKGSVTPEVRVLRSRVITFGGDSSASVVSPEVRPEADSIRRSLRPRATPRVPVLYKYTLGSSSDSSSRPTPRRSSRIASRLGSDHQQSHKIKMELNLELELEPEPESEPEEEEAEPEPGPSSRAQARLSTFRPAVRRRPTRSPPRRPVRMRASSPSPPGRLYPFPGQYNEGASSSSSFTNEDVSCVSSSPSFPHKSPERDSSSPSGDLSSVSGPSSDTLWRAFIPDLDNLDSAPSGESEEEIEIAPHPPA
ncbi:uncharacterized protein CXorf67-like [Grammomys surdaster]|uniref:uncharacterized protein CXorf67-like n=1 Tax=Grammomys surdaster TaxID=491861 RepID=UPI00109FC369|nr:uncharacterized protein CXorf67-like [Grammomys surdaster]